MACPNPNKRGGCGCIDVTILHWCFVCDIPHADVRCNRCGYRFIILKKDVEMPRDF